MTRMATLVVLLFSMLVTNGLAEAQDDQSESVFLIRLDDELIEALKNGEALKSKIPPNVDFSMVKIIYEPGNSAPPANQGQTQFNGNSFPNQSQSNPNTTGANNGNQGFNNRSDTNQVPIVPRNNGQTPNNNGSSGGSFSGDSSQNSGNFQPRQPTQNPDNQMFGQQNGTARNPNNTTPPWETNQGNNSSSNNGANRGNNQGVPATAPNLYNQNQNGGTNQNSNSSNQLSPQQPQYGPNLPENNTQNQWQGNTGQYNPIQDNSGNRQFFAQQRNNQVETPQYNDWNYDPRNTQSQLANNHLARRQNTTLGHNEPFIPTTLTSTNQRNNAMANNSVGNRDEGTPPASINGSNNASTNPELGGNLPIAQIPENKHVTFLWFMLLVSIGLNFYLGWISRSFYVRYRELADELRETFSSSI